ncbi:MAG: entericidin A/B family lipoprotein [Opitutales bacterium]|nr:entericidin A/B family lipoprotein [Opitutales bacterium]
MARISHRSIALAAQNAGGTPALPANHLLIRAIAVEARATAEPFRGRKALVASGCNTMKGVGKDTEAAGEAIQESAR